MRDDFSAAVKQIVANRVNSTCSKCGAPTSGPQINTDKAINIGVAAHISAASIGGPRYDSSLSSEERGYASNAIWLCQTCAKLIDSDVVRFPVKELLSWKAKAEISAFQSLGKTAASVDGANSDLSAEEIDILSAASTKGEIHIIETEEFDPIILVEGVAFADDTDPAYAALYRDALQSLQTRGLVRHSVGILYVLTGRGYTLGRSLNQSRIKLYQYPKNLSVFTLPGTHRKNPYFTPKEEVNAALSSLLAGDNLVLCGPPGVGKTQHAVQFAHQNHSQYSMVLWASADSVPGFYQALTTLADLIFPAGNINYLIEDKVKALREWLETKPDWLLILDNADSVEVVREIERFIPPAHQGIVLITSQITDWTAAFHREHLDVWTNKQATEFLTQRLPWCATEQDTFARLSRELGGLPLALEHAAAYITETKTLPAEYLDILSRDQKRIFRRKYPGMTDYQASIAATWELSTRRLGWLARQILHLASGLASEPIPRHFFSQLLPMVQEDFLCGPFERRKYERVLMSPDAINLAFGELARYSLITLSENTLRLHPLLQWVVLDSARIRPWQARFWLCRLWQIGQSRWSLGAGLWLYRTAVILNKDDELSFYVNDLEMLKMRTFIAHPQALIRNIMNTAPEILEKYTVSPIKHGLEWFERKLNEYDAGMKILRELFEDNARRSPDLMSETEWFVSNVEEFYKQVFGISQHPDLSHYLRWLSEGGEWDIRKESYHFLNILAAKQAALGEIDTAKRLFRFYIAHAMADPEAPSGEVAHAKLREVISLLNHWNGELNKRLEEALILNEDMNYAPLDIWSALWNYSRLADTPEEEDRAHQLIIKALPPARRWLEHGCNHACVLTVEYVRRLEENEEFDEALSACEETLYLALRSKRLKNRSVTMLWCQRGRLLRQQEKFLTSARSFARCLTLEIKNEEITPLRQIDLSYVIGDMFLKAKLFPAAKKYLLQANDLLEMHWSDDPQESGFYALLIGSDLGQVQEEAKGEVMLRKGLELYQKNL